jgi:Secretion system C-terminal sorting domain
MKKLSLLIVSLIFGTNVFAQQRYTLKTEHIKGQEIICPARYIDEPSFVDIPANIKQKLNNKNARPGDSKAANIIVNYVNFPPNAKASFQRAVDIWALSLASTVPVRVTARWEELDRNVLGSANATDFYRNFPGAKVPNTFYPIALAEKLAGIELNSVNEDDIICRFNSKVPWYFGTVNAIPNGQFDFTSIVLHELGHGLGFISSMRVANSQGSYGYGTRFNAIYDKFIQTGDGKNLVDLKSFTNPSAGLRNSLISRDLFFVSPRNPSNTDKVELYAPSPYEGGSSISHLDDEKYLTGDINSLMTPSAAQREINLNPGPIVLKMFADMGWKSTSIVHTPIKDAAILTKFKLETTILTDTTLIPKTAKVFYAFNYATGVKLIEAELSPSPNGKYFVNIDVPATAKTFDYYFEVKDNFGETTRSPGNGGFATGSSVWGFDIGKKDIYGPEIDHFGPDILYSSSPVSIIANVVDDYQEGIDTVYINYSVNGVAKAPIGLKKYDPIKDNKAFSQGRGDEFAYLAENAIKGLTNGDKVKYQIIAIDKAKNKTLIPEFYNTTNQRDLPVESFYEFTTTTIKNAPVTQYVNDFETSNDDFALLGFSQDTPSGFTSKSLNSSHPYTNGLGSFNKKSVADTTLSPINIVFEKSEIAMLRTPIKLKQDSAIITFDEVVLVEPGDAGSLFGDNDFYDYVVVEGSLDGDFWFPLEDGYDSRKEKAWESLFTSTLSTGTSPNSNGKGSQTLIKKREINIYGTDFTNEFAGENLLIRFRMYADQFTGGWGWSIDNLLIQKPKPVILANEPTNKTKNIIVYPNPTTDKLKIKLDVAENQNVNVEIYSLRGSLVYQENIPVEGLELNHEVNIGNLTPGTYMIKMTEKRGQVVRRFVVAGSK